MGCQTAVDLGNNLTFTITTHDPDTGELTDADAAPAYRVYENETGVAILTGTMTALDAVNTTGFYSEQIACTTANGFETGYSYNIYIEATVDGDTGGISYAFTVNSAVNPAASSYTAVTGSHVTIVRGDTWEGSITGLGDLTDYTKLWFTVKCQKGDADTAAVLQVLLSNPGVATDGLQRLNGAATTAAYGSIVVTNAALGNITITISKLATAVLRESARYYDIQMLESDGTVTTLAIGECDVNLDVTMATS